MIDPKLAGLLSDFFLDIAKAFFIASFITPELSHVKNIFELFSVLFNGLICVSISLWFSRQFLEINTTYESI